MNSFSHVPPGYRFHPTDEELISYYLRKKVASKGIDLDVIKVIDLYKIEPWDLQALCRIGNDEEGDCYFFSHKDKKYPTGTRANRATNRGFWKATGRDKAIHSKRGLIGMRKTLVFYTGRAPGGVKTEWIMHEYQLKTSENGTSHEEGWVVCKVFKKKMAAARKEGQKEKICYLDNQVSFMPDPNPQPLVPVEPSTLVPVEPSYSNYNNQYNVLSDSFLQLPNLESPKAQDTTGTLLPLASFPSQYLQESIDHQRDIDMINELCNFDMFNDLQIVDDQATTDWMGFDNFVAPQFGRDGAVNSNYI